MRPEARDQLQRKRRNRNRCDGRKNRGAPSECNPGVSSWEVTGHDEKTKHKTAESRRRRITINSITRLEGRGKIEILLSEKGCFERFAYERPTEDMAKIASRSCGMCPTTHHMAATKVLDGLY